MHVGITGTRDEKEYQYIEKTMSLQNYKALCASIELLKMSRANAQPSVSLAIQRFFDPISSMNWQMSRKNQSEYMKNGVWKH